MINKKGYAAQDRIKQDIEFAKNIEDPADRNILATKALGAADLAIEFGLITYQEWEQHIEEIFTLI